MDKLQAYHSFWSGFGWKAYDETSVPDTAQMPYITYEVAEGFFDQDVAMTASLWIRSEGWQEIVAKSKQIAEQITRGGKLIKYDGGAFWIKREQPWAQRMSDASDDAVRRIVLNMSVEYID